LEHCKTGGQHGSKWGPGGHPTWEGTERVEGRKEKKPKNYRGGKATRKEKSKGRGKEFRTNISNQGSNPNQGFSFLAITTVCCAKVEKKRAGRGPTGGEQTI